MSNKLKIYACSGIGNPAEIKQWVSDGTTAADNTQAMNSLLADINLQITRLRFADTLTSDEVIQAHNWLDLYSVCFYFARLYRHDSEQLAAAGQAIGKLLADKAFDSTVSDTDWHANRVDELIGTVERMMEDGDSPALSGEFGAWWDKVILGGNTVGLENDGVGATFKQDYGDLNKYLYDGGTYFLYLYLSDDQIKNLPYVFRKKRRKQKELYDYCKKVFCKEYGGIYGSEADMQKVIRTGIIEDFKGKTPEEVAKSIANKEGVGLGVTAIMAIISAVVTLILGIVKLIVDYAASVAVAKYAVPADPESGCPEEEDFVSKAKNVIKDNWLLLLGGAAVVFYLFSNKK